MVKKTVAVEKEEEKVINYAPVEEMNIAEYAGTSYLDYSMSVITDRAIPSVEDGFKPVHRRIFYAMSQLGITDVSKPVKSARVVGEVLGKYHPHGDLAVYEAMVVQTQPFRMRYPIPEGQGNFGSRDGDAFAASRYTEIKFSPIYETIISELRQGAADFKPNFDGEEEEPKFLPVRLPFVLLNYTEGIGVGMATSMPSHNLREVVSAVISFLEKDNPTIDDMLEHIKGPDFPTAAQIISSKEEIKQIYEEGRGSFRMRSKYFIENPGTKNWKLVFNEIPFGTSPEKVMFEIQDVFEPEAKLKKSQDKKKISPEQLRLKQLFINTIDDFRNESDKTHGLRLVIIPKSFKQDPDELVQILFASTSLEMNYPTNFVVIGRDGNPVNKNLLQIIAEWSDFRLETIEKRCKWFLKKIADRLELLEGRKKILSNIDRVIEILKTSESPKADLIKEFELTERQAEDILDLRLRQIGKLELESILKEMDKLNKEKADLERIISSEKNLKKQMIKELKEDMAKYGDDRKTEIIEGANRTQNNILHEKTTKIAEEKITLAISKKAWVKVMKGEKVKEDFNFKEGDEVDYLFYCKNTDTLAAFDTDGKVYNYALTELGKDGAPLNTLFEMSGKFLLACPIHKDFKYVLAHSEGYGFIITGENLTTKLKVGKNVYAIPEGATMFQPLYFHKDEVKENMKVALISTENRLLMYKLSDISEIGKGKGVGLMGFNAEHKLKALKLLREEKVNVQVKEKRKQYVLTLEGEEFNKHLQNRSVSAKGKTLNIKDKLAEINFASDNKDESSTQENKEETKN